MSEYYIQVHKAKHMFKLIKDSMVLLDKCVANPVMKNILKVDLNKCLQFLTLKDLKVIDENNKRHNKPEETIPQT